MKKFHPAFLVFSLVLLFCGYGIFFLTYLIAIILHELGHSLVAKKLGYKLKNFYLMPYGACLSYDDTFVENDELKIAIAGPITSLLVGFLCISLWWIFPVTYNYTENFVLANFAIAVFNFLPAFPLDGSRVLINLLTEKITRKKALKITVIFNYALSLLFVLLFIISIFSYVNFSFIIIALFLFLGIFDASFQGKYLPYYCFDKKKNIYKGINTNVVTMSSASQIFLARRKLSLNKYNIFYIVYRHGQSKMIGEDTLKLLLENYDLKMTFEDIFSTKYIN